MMKHKDKLSGSRNAAQCRIQGLYRTPAAGYQAPSFLRKQESSFDVSE